MDDTQLYLHCGRDETAQTTVRLEQCIKDINHWMSANRLMLNADKTELLCVGTKYCLSVSDGRFPCLRLGEDTVFASQHVRVLE